MVRLPLHVYNLTVGRLTAKKEADTKSQAPEVEDAADAAQRTPGNDSVSEEFELLDKSTDSLGKAKSSRMEKSGKSNKRKNKKR